MEDTWVMPVTVESPLLSDNLGKYDYQTIDVDMHGDWNTCPIDDSPNYACNFLSGVTNDEQIR